MTATQTLEQWFEQADQSLPVLTDSARIAVVVLGLALCLIGGHLIKTVCVVGGLMLGMIVGGLALPFVESAPIGVGIMVGLGLLGALAAWLIFRAWVAFAAALMFAIAAPAGVMAWQGITTGALEEDNRTTARSVQQRVDDAKQEMSDDLRLQVQSLVEQGDREALTQADKLLAEQGYAAAENAKGVVFRNLESMRDWWMQNSTEAQRTVGLSMLIGGGIGFLLGLILPTIAVGIQSALVGAILIVIPGRELVVMHLPQAEGFIPQTASGTLVLIGLITAGALALQWMLARPDDKES